jgi:hypothetical protein
MARKQAAAQAAPQAPAKTVFVVMRNNWRRRHDGWRRQEGQFSLASFDSADRAESERVRLEDNARRRLNPFRCGEDLSDLTSFPEAVFLDWVQDAGLTPPEAKKRKRDWAAWWQTVAPRAGADQRAKVWQALDKLRFYHVAERPAVAVGYVVLSAIWHYNDEYNYLNSEGGAVQAVYRTRERALQEASKLSDRGDGAPGDWFPSGADPFDPEAHWALFERGHTAVDVVEIELEGLS